MHESESYFAGLDIGTNSVGAAITDRFYHVKKFQGNAMWTSAVFDSAEQSADRRTNRTARRRLDRRQQRRDLLQELLAPAILSIDPHFYDRIRESALWADDKTTGSRFTYFSGDGYTDREFHKEYPTIHHLIVELMKSSKPHDPRLVYIACSYILTHRGHFLNQADKDKVEDVLDIEQVYSSLSEWYQSTVESECPFRCTAKEFGEVLTDNKGIKNRTKAFYDLLFGGKKPKPSEGDPVDPDSLLSLISGGRVELSKLFMNEPSKTEESVIAGNCFSTRFSLSDFSRSGVATARASTPKTIKTNTAEVTAQTAVTRSFLFSFSFFRTELSLIFQPLRI